MVAADGPLAGEYSVDLYTLPEALQKSLWDFMAKLGVVS